MRIATMSTSSSKNHTGSCSEDDAELRRGPWTLEEDTFLVHYIARHGEGRWNLLAKRAGLRRTGKSCRLRWLNYLKPDVKRGNLTPHEQLLILDLHSKWGNRWSKIAQHLPGRTDNEIKNYWRTRVQKQARHLKLDANSSTFQEIIKCVWMPRLVQKIEGSTSAATSDPVLPISDNPLFFTQNSTLLTPPPPPQVLHGQDQNSDSEVHGRSTSCISSSESINVSQMSQLSEYLTSSCLPSVGDYNALIKTYVDSYDMDVINSFANISESPGFGMPQGNSHMAESDWTGYELLDATWNMDELWQFRNLQEREA